MSAPRNPSKFTTLEYLQRIKLDNYISLGGVEYNVAEVDELILTKKMKQAEEFPRFAVVQDSEILKRCPGQGGHDVPVNQFHLDAKNPSGLHGHCKTCRKIAVVKNYQPAGLNTSGPTIGV